MRAEDLIEQLGSELGLDDLRLNEDGVARLIVGEDAIIDLEHDEEGGQLQIHSVLGAAPESALELRELLAANLFGIATGGATLALDDEADEIVLYRSLDLDSLAVERCIDVLNLFVQAAELWNRRLAGVELDDEESPGRQEPRSDTEPGIRV